MYTVAELTESTADYLDQNNYPAFKNSTSGRFYTYRETALAQLTEDKYTIVEITQTEMDGTLPISPNKPKKPMFPI